MAQKQKIRLVDKLGGAKNKNLSNKEYLGGKGKFHGLRLHIFNRFLGILILCLAVYFVAGINDLSIKGFVLHELKVKAAELNNENKNIELKIMELESYENIDKRANDLKMVKVGKIDYITVLDESVAKK